MTRLPLGQDTEYPQEYEPGVLYAIARSEARGPLGLSDPLPFTGSDIWNAWELTWLDAGGKPVVATAEIRVGAESPHIVESKSLKLYLGSFAMSRFESGPDVASHIAADLSRVTGSGVDVSVFTDDDAPMSAVRSLPGDCLDGLAIEAAGDDVDADLLVAGTGDPVAESLHSHLLRSLCPVTNQPDYGSVLVRYHGPPIDRRALLGYLVSYRQHNDFHEACVERMFLDIKSRCAPNQLTVYARYNRRGGIDINPFRSDFEERVENLRLWRQ